LRGIAVLVLGVAAYLPVPALRAQAHVFSVSTNSEAALDAAIRGANALTFQTSSANPVVIEFSSGLIGQTIALTQALPQLTVDYVTLRVAAAAEATVGLPACRS